MPGDLRHQLGATGETLAAAHLERMGMRILARNARTRFAAPSAATAIVRSHEIEVRDLAVYEQLLEVA